MFLDYIAVRGEDRIGRAGPFAVALLGWQNRRMIHAMHNDCSVSTWCETLPSAAVGRGSACSVKLNCLGIKRVLTVVVAINPSPTYINLNPVTYRQGD